MSSSNHNQNNSHSRTSKKIWLVGQDLWRRIVNQLSRPGNRVGTFVEHSSMADVPVLRIYSCYNCRNHVARHDDIISKNFQSSHGRAFLFSHAMNIVEGPKENRNLMTGLHVVSDVYCQDCRKVLGWKYEKAYEQTQKYKEGKFVLEKFKIKKENF